MPQQYGQEPTNTFVKGLITEAGELTFPKDASVDELNCDLLRTGSRRRRLGVALEEDAVFSTFETNVGQVIHITEWESVAAIGGKDFLVVQVANKLVFYEQSGSRISDNRVNESKTSSNPYQLNLSDYNRENGNGASTARVQTTTIRGALVVVSPEINPILVEYDSDTGEFSVEQIRFRERDFEWLSDITLLPRPLATQLVGAKRKYDTQNTGWNNPDYSNSVSALDSYTSQFGAWPELSKPWHIGLIQEGDDFNWETDLFTNPYTGNSLAANGHYILDIFEKNRGEVSGIPNIGTSKERARFAAAEAYAGRVFYAGLNGSTTKSSSKVYFSQILQGGLEKIGDCFQQNDPTSNTLSDLLDTDGGVIEISGASNISRLHVFGSTLYVFAENGIWGISGVESDVFRATSYYVFKVSEIGLDNPNSFVSASGRPYWWSATGIHTLGTENGTIQEINLSLPTIQSFWRNIGEAARYDCTGCYDRENNRVYWFYSNVGEEDTSKMNNVLIFDEVLQAFFPWKIADEAVNTDYVIAGFFYNGLGQNTEDFQVVDSQLNPVVDSNGNNVVVERNATSYSRPSVKLLVREGSAGKLTFAEFSSVSFLDWGSAEYKSYAETYYNFMGDLTTRKTHPYVTIYCKDTDVDSSILVSTIWDFKDRPSTRPQQGYRPSFNQSMSIRKLRLRGRGRSARFRFESDGDKDFYLNGFDVIVAKNERF